MLLVCLLICVHHCVLFICVLFMLMFHHSLLYSSHISFVSSLILFPSIHVNLHLSGCSNQHSMTEEWNRYESGLGHTTNLGQKIAFSRCYFLLLHSSHIFHFYISSSIKGTIKETRNYEIHMSVLLYFFSFPLFCN